MEGGREGKRKEGGRSEEEKGGRHARWQRQLGEMQTTK